MQSFQPPIPAAAPEPSVELVTIAKAAAMLGVSESTLRYWDKTDKLCAVRHPLNGYRYYRLDAVRALRERLAAFMEVSS